MANAIDIHRPTAELTRTGLDVRRLSEAWTHKPKGRRFTEALIGFLGSKDNPNTRKSYAFAITEFFAWYDSHFRRIPAPDEVRRAEAFAYRQYLESRTIGLDEYRLSNDPDRELDLVIYRYVKAHGGCDITAIRRELMSHGRFTTTVTFVAGGRQHSLRVLTLEEDDLQGDDLASYVAAHGRNPPNGLDLRLACLCQHNLLHRTPTVEEIRKAAIDVGEEHPDQAQIGYRVDPEVFRYSIEVHTDAKPSERLTTVLLRLTALSSFWNYLADSGENVGDTESLLKHNVWRAATKDLRKRVASHQKVARELSTPDLELFVTILAETFRRSHPEQHREAAEATLDGADVSRMATGRASALDLRDRSALLLVYWTGLRAGEMEHLRRSDLTVSERGALLDVLGKGGQRRLVSVPSPAVRALEDLQIELLKMANSAEARPDALVHRLVLPHSPLVPPVQRWGSSALDVEAEVPGLSESRFLRILHELGAAAGITPDSPEMKKLHPHGLRHLAASEARRRGVDLPTIQATLGHKSPATTGLYVEVRDAYERTLEKTPSAMPQERRHVVVSPPAPRPERQQERQERPAAAITLEPSEAAVLLSETEEAVRIALETYKSHWGEQGKRVALSHGATGLLGHAYVGKETGLPWWTGATGAMNDKTFSYTPNPALPAMPVISPSQFLGDIGTEVCGAPLCKALASLYDEWWSDERRGPTAASALALWLGLSASISADADEVVRNRNGGWLEFDAPIGDTSLHGAPNALRIHLDDAIVAWFRHSAWQFMPSVESRTPVGGELAIPDWYGETDPLASLPEKDRLELLDWLQVLVGLPPKDSTPRFGRLSRRDVGKFLSEICGYETTAADEDIPPKDRKDYLRAIEDQIERTVAALTESRVRDFRYSTSKARRKTEKLRGELEAKVAERTGEDEPKGVPRRLASHMMGSVAQLFGEEAGADHVLNLFALCTSGAPLRDVLDKYKNLFRVSGGTIQHTAEFKKDFAEATAQHSECVARRVARHIFDEGRLGSWYERRNWPDTTIPYLEAMTAYRVPCPASQETELRHLLGATRPLSVFDTWKRASGGMLAQEVGPSEAEMMFLEEQETKRAKPTRPPVAKENPNRAKQRLVAARRQLPNGVDLMAIQFVRRRTVP